MRGGALVTGTAGKRRAGRHAERGSAKYRCVGKQADAASGKGGDPGSNPGTARTRVAGKVGGIAVHREAETARGRPWTVNGF